MKVLVFINRNYIDEYKEKPEVRAVFAAKYVSRRYGKPGVKEIKFRDVTIRPDTFERNRTYVTQRYARGISFSRWGFGDRPKEYSAFCEYLFANGFVMVGSIKRNNDKFMLAEAHDMLENFLLGKKAEVVTEVPATVPWEPAGAGWFNGS